MRRALAITLLLAGAATAPAHAADVPEAELGPWLSVGVGIDTFDDVDLSEGARGDLVEDQGAVGGLLVEMFLTTLRFDYGMSLRHEMGGNYQRPNGLTGQFGSSVTAGPLLRWRYWQVEPGSFYLEFIPAWVGIVHSPYVRRDAATMHGLDTEDLPSVTHGFSTSISTGLLFMLSPSLALDLSAYATFIDAEMEVSGTPNVTACEEGQCIDYDRSRAGLQLAFCWTL